MGCTSVQVYQVVVESFNPRRANAVTKIFYAASGFVDIGEESISAYKVTEFKEEAISFAKERLGNEEYQRYVEEYERLREIVRSKKLQKIKMEGQTEIESNLLTEEEIEDIYSFGGKTMEIFDAIGEKFPDSKE